jgi:hypothetical protein
MTAIHINLTETNHLKSISFRNGKSFHLMRLV